MKGTPEMPQCGFSRASIQILGLQGVDPGKFAAFNVLEDPELRSGIPPWSLLHSILCTHQHTPTRPCASMGESWSKPER
jgi:glutaredoxin-related protein